MCPENNSQRGFGLLELMVSLMVVAILLTGAYKVSISTVQSTIFSSKSERLSRDAALLRYHLERRIKMIGYNPQFVQFPDCARPDCPVIPPNTPPTADSRIGLTSAKFSEFEYTSDDNDLVLPGSGGIGQIQNGERYAIWLAENDGGAHVSFEGKTNPIGDPCTENGTPFDTSYKMYAKRKSTITTTQDEVLAENVLCFEVRYYREGDPAQFEAKWVRLCPSSINCPTNPSIPSTANPIVSELLHHAAPFATPNEEADYFSDIVRLTKVEVGLILKRPDEPGKPGNRKERVNFSIKLPNLPWLLTKSDAILQSG